MTSVDQLWEAFADVLAGRPTDEPWERDADGVPRFVPDGAALGALMALPIEAGSGSQTGRLARAIDAWVASELRRAGFAPDEVWPRAENPRVLPRELALYLQRLSGAEREQAAARILSNRAIAPGDARILGRAYVKQVDVVISHWSRGPELLVSTKSMVSSFRKNLANRFEEAYGDAKNLRGRYPLSAMGFLLLLRSTALREPGTVDRVVDMLRKLRDDRDAYDATCLVLADWSDPPDFSGVSFRDDLVLPDLSTATFLATLVTTVLDRTPINMHVEVRERREQRRLDIEEAGTGDESSP